MKFSPAIEAAICKSRARVIVGYPWWLRPFMQHGVIAITLGRRVYVNAEHPHRDQRSIDRMMRHELTHVRQVQRVGVVRFYWRYAVEFVKHFIRERDAGKAYRSIAFEVEAYAAESGPDV